MQGQCEVCRQWSDEVKRLDSGQIICSQCAAPFQESEPDRELEVAPTPPPTPTETASQWEAAEGIAILFRVIGWVSIALGMIAGFGDWSRGYGRGRFHTDNTYGAAANALENIERQLGQGAFGPATAVVAGSLFLILAELVLIRAHLRAKR